MHQKLTAVVTEAGVVHAERTGQWSRRRTRPSSKPPSGTASRSALLHGHAARRQLPHLHGGDQRRARAGAVLLPLSGRDGGHTNSARALTSQKMSIELLLSTCVPGGCTLNSELDLWARKMGVAKPRFAPRISRLKTSRIRRWR